MQAISNSTANSQPFSITQALGGAQASKDEFLSLLVAQLRHQDPFAPMKNQDFLTQLATFSQLEEQQKTSQGIQDLATLQNASLVLGGLSQGAALVGKRVGYIDPATGQVVEGLVSSVAFDPTGVVLTIGEQTVPAGNVVSISVAEGSGGAAGNNPLPPPSGTPTTPPGTPDPYDGTPPAGQ